jgi:hypothetical protein
MRFLMTILVSKKYSVSTFLFKETPCEGSTHLLQWNYLKYIKLSRSQWLRHWLHPLEHWDRRFESHSRHWYSCTFILCLYCPMYVAALRRADHSSKESYRLSIRLRNWSETKPFTDALCAKGSNRNMNEWMNEWINEWLNEYKVKNRYRN